MTVKTFAYGRMLEDFEVGATYAHPWDVTIDGGTIALFQASFLDATPTYASARFARELGFRDRPVHPLLLLNLGLSFSVHDVSEQAIAHLAYIDARFPHACFVGDTVTASSTVLGVNRSSSGDKGVVHVRTIVENQDAAIVCAFERKALVRAGGKLANRPSIANASGIARATGEIARLPQELRAAIPTNARRGAFFGTSDDFAEGDVFAHEIGKTVSEAEHMQLTFLFRNSHPLHFDELFAKSGGSFAGTRVVYGGLVFAWIASLASRDTMGHVVWDLGFDNGAHPNGVVAGDTLYAASKVIRKTAHDSHHDAITFRLVGLKNTKASALLASGIDLFTSELSKKEGKVKEKVFEIDRAVLVRKAGP